MKLGCGTTEAAMQAARVQAELMASQLRAAKHALECEKDETQALRQQVWRQMCPSDHNFSLPVCICPMQSLPIFLATPVASFVAQTRQRGNLHMPQVCKQRFKYCPVQCSADTHLMTCLMALPQACLAAAGAELAE